MTTLRQIQANQKNAQKSTGPRTEDGKSVSARNAWKHGHSGAFLPEEEMAIVTARVEEWSATLEPAPGLETWFVEQAAIESVRVERYQRQEQAQRAHLARRAGLCWDADRWLAAETLLTKLAKHPALVRLQLTQTPQGCACLLERWAGLERALDQNGCWTEAQRALALDLLGVGPEVRDLPTLLDPRSGNNPLEVCRAALRAEVERLTALQAALQPLDTAEQADAKQADGVDSDRALQLIRRYERASARRAQWALSQFEDARRVRREIESIPPDERYIPPRALPTPAPEPIPTERPAVEPFAEVFPPQTRHVPLPALNRHDRRALRRELQHA